MSKRAPDLADPRISAALADLQRRIEERFPDASFSSYRGEDPEGMYLRAVVDIEDPEEVLDVVIDRLIELGDDELPVYVVAVQTTRRPEPTTEDRNGPTPAQRAQYGSAGEPMTAIEQSTMKQYQTILYAKRDGICYITLNRPEKLNAGNDQMVEELRDAFFEFDADPELYVAIVSGNGRAFCSGADVRQRQLRTPEEMRRLGGPAGRNAKGVGLDETVNWKPVIAAVHGYALGLGFGLAQSSDLIVAAEGTKFQIREVQRGIGGSTHWASTWFWTGSRFANEVALTGRMFTAEEALQQGMVNRVVPKEELIATAEALARQVMENPPLSVRANVRVMRRFVHELEREVRFYTQGLGLHLTDDFRESALAFMEKRPPVFKGR